MDVQRVPAKHKLVSRDNLSSKISRILKTCNLGDREMTFFNFISNEMVADINMLRSLVVDRVPTQV